MEIKNRLFPYPVLTFYNDDYVNSRFDVNVSTEVSRSIIKFTFIISLENDHLVNLLENDLVEFGIHIECPSTSFRKLLCFSDDIYEYEIDAGMLNGKVQICPFILAKVDLVDYINPAFNTTYHGFSFEIDAHNIMAIGAPSDVPVEKEYDEIKNVNSIFAVVPVREESCKFMQVSLDYDVIYVRLPFEYFESYKFIRHSPDHIKIIHSLFIIPILVTIFEKFAYGGEEVMCDYEDFLWYKSLKKAIENKKIVFNSESLQNLDRLELAQDLTNNPILVSINEMFINNVRGNKDED